MLVVCHLIYDWQTGGERSFFGNVKIIKEVSVNSCFSRTRFHSFFSNVAKLKGRPVFGA